VRVAEAVSATSGRWYGILSSLGVPAAALRNKHGPCPLGCGGRRSFRFDDKGGRGTWICSHCGAGDGFDLVAAMNHLSLNEAMARSVEAATGVQQRRPQEKMTDEQARERGRAMWKKSSPITPDDPAGRYLTSRLGFFPRGTGLLIAETEYYDGGTAIRYPTMLAAVISPDGEIVGLHRF
jgi:putative DNA primase/helicase